MTNPEVTCRIKVCAAETQLLLPEGTGRAPAPHPDTGVRAGDAGRGRPVPLACRPSVWGQTASPKTCQSTVPWLISRSQHSGGSCETTSSRARLQAQDGPSADLASYLRVPHEPCSSCRSPCPSRISQIKGHGFGEAEIIF